MKIITPGYEFIRPHTGDGGGGRYAIYHLIETAGRTCYKSEGRGEPEKFVKRLVESGHEAMLEHASMTVKFIVDRAVANEIVRHRVASYAQESTRYCNYSLDKFGGEVTFIKPFYLTEGTDGYAVWGRACMEAEKAYFALLAYGCDAQEARAVLPLCTKTELIMTANMREWRHFFKLRAAGTTGAPHPQMREVAMALLNECKGYMPELFGDIDSVCHMR